ncbi:MAG: metallophosphoesterase family protein, partial [Candidatus Bathyarchaeia archaeon]
VGDLHGDLRSLIGILSKSRTLARMGKSILVFLGDYGDRGDRSAEVYYTILRLKSEHPNSVLLLRGNHEGPEDLRALPHDLPHHLKRRLGDGWDSVYRGPLNLFPALCPEALIPEKYLMVHGGLPSTARTLSDLAFADQAHPGKPHLEEVLWSDPVEGLEGAAPSERGAGRRFGPDVTERMLKIFGAKTLIRGHEPSERGFMVGHGGRILTLFSRSGPPYYNRWAAYLDLDTVGEALDAFQLAEMVRLV